MSNLQKDRPYFKFQVNLLSCFSKVCMGPEAAHKAVMTKKHGRHIFNVSPVRLDSILLSAWRA